MHPGTHVFLQFEDTGRREQLHGLAWSLPEHMVVAAVQVVDPKLKVEIVQLSRRRHRSMRYLCAHVHY